MKTMSINYVRGYWITRYLPETQVELLKSFLIQRRDHPALEETLAAALGLERE